MPLYDYKCTSEKCNESFEVKISLSDLATAQVKCPKCESEAKKDISPLKAVSSTWKHWRL